MVQDRGLGPVLPGLPIEQCRPIGDAWPRRSLPISTSTEEKAICPHHSQRHPYPNIVNHLRVALLPLRPHMSCQSPLCIPCLATSNTVYSVDQRSEVLSHLMARIKVLILLLLLMRCQNLGVIPTSSRPCISISNAHINQKP